MNLAIKNEQRACHYFELAKEYLKDVERVLQTAHQLTPRPATSNKHDEELDDRAVASQENPHNVMDVDGAVEHLIGTLDLMIAESQRLSVVAAAGNLQGAHACIVKYEEDRRVATEQANKRARTSHDEADDEEDGEADGEADGAYNEAEHAAATFP